MPEIVIERKFYPFFINNKSDDELDQNFRYDANSLSWNDLYNNYDRILILSTAGTGKTYECKQQAEKLAYKGLPAFFLELTDLANANSALNLMSYEKESIFNEWLTSDATAYFFLDSIDELQLTQQSFGKALRNFTQLIKNNFNRVKVIITSRPTSFDKNLILECLPIQASVVVQNDKEEVISDLSSKELFIQLAMRQKGDLKTDLSFTPQQNKTEERIATVDLKEFSDEDILVFAQQQGVSNPSAFLEQLLDSSSIDINSARQPQYLMELCNGWATEHVIRPKHQRTKHLIESLLHQRTDRKEKKDLSLEKAKQGVKQLAFALILMGKTTILYDGTAQSTHINAIDPRKILTDWSQAEWQTLLERPLFLLASDGKVRFSHRSITEYLAASQLNDMIGKGVSIKSIKRLMFSQTSKGYIIKPIMLPVAAWLACFNSRFIETVREHIPELLFKEADMSLLTDDQKISVLRSYVDHYKKFAWRNEAIHSFHAEGAASEKLTKEIVGVWPTIENDIIRYSLMWLMAKAPVPECADIAYESATGKTSRFLIDEIRKPALIILAQLRDSRLEQLLNDMEAKADVWTSKNVEEVLLLDGIYPSHLKTSRLLKILNLVDFPSHHVGTINSIWPRELILFTSKYPIEMIKELQEGLTTLIISNISTEDSIYHLKTSKYFLLPALVATCIRLLKDNQIDENILRSSVYALALFLYDDSYANDELFVQLKDLLHQQPSDVRKLIFWLCDELGQKYDREHDSVWRLTRASNILSLDCSYGSCDNLFLSLDRDQVWLIECLVDQQRDPQGRLIMLQALLDLSVRNSHSLDFNSLQDKVIDSPILIAKLEQFMHAKTDEQQKSEWLIKNEEKKKEKTLEQERKQAERRESWINFYNIILNDPDKAFGNEQYQHTVFNLWCSLLFKNMDLHSKSWNRALISKIFNDKTCNQFRNALMRFWRHQSPTLKSERPIEIKNSYPMIWCTGITAISAEAEDPKWAEKLTTEEAKLAARYATIELNHFPNWFESLAVVQPKAIVEALGDELALSLNKKLEVNFFHDSLFEQIKLSSSHVINIYSPILMNWVSQFDKNMPKAPSAGDLDRFKRVIDLLLMNNDVNVQKQIEVFIQNWLEKYKNNSLFTVAWLEVLMPLNPEKATEQLEKLLKKEVKKQGSDKIAIDWLSAVFKDLWYSQNEKRSEILTKLQSLPEVLADLILLAFQYVRPEDDLDRANEGVYTPNARDHAETIRYALLEALLNSTGEIAYQHKMNLRDSPLLESAKNYIWDKTRQSQMRDVCEIPFDEAHVIEVIKIGEIKPNNNAAIFQLMKDRLDDLSEHLLSDFSPKSRWQNIQMEIDIRKEVAHFLHLKSNNLYSVNQEAVTGDEKETDIRLVAKNHVAVIELKLGDNWSGTVLRNTINDQLFKQYMQPENRKAGCLLIVTNKKRNWEHPDTGKLLDIDGLQEMLDQEAQRVTEENRDSIFLTVYILDLCNDTTN